MSIYVFLGVVMGVAAAAQVGAITVRRVRALQRAAATRRRYLEGVSAGVRKQARLSLDLKRERQRMSDEVERMRADIASNEAIAAAQLADESLLYVYDERKMPNDQGFVVDIRHPNYQSLSRGAPREVTDSWRQGRRYLVWASSAKLALAKTIQRFPADRGYTVSGGELHPNPPGEV